MATVNLGRIKPVFRGAYNNSTAYVVDDIVTSGNETFICISASTGNATSNGTFWTKLAAKGADGADGTDVGAVLANKEIAFKTNAGAVDCIPIGAAGTALKVNSGATGYEFGTAGGLNQLVTARDNTVKTRSSAGTIDLVSLTITPSSTSSKILLLMQCAWGYDAGGNSPNASMFPKRAISGGSTTTLSQEAATGSSPGGVAASEQKTAYGTECIQMLGGHYVDSPNTTSAITYTMVYRVEDCGVRTMYVGSPGSTNTASWHTRVPHTITAIEVVV